MQSPASSGIPISSLSGSAQDALLSGLDTFTSLPAAQQPEWPDRDVLDQVRAELSTYPPLVFAGECDHLKNELAEAARGEAFLLQGGDCAETFAEPTPTASATRSGPCCRWRWCSPTAPACR